MISLGVYSCASTSPWKNPKPTSGSTNMVHVRFREFQHSYANLENLLLNKSRH